MNPIQSFDIREADGYEACPRVCDFPDVKPEDIVGGNRLITSREKIQITFDYPLSHSVPIEFANPGGFTCWDFFKAVYDGYSQIYAEEEQAVGNPGHIPGMLNRSVSQGPYGIWGHDMEDLFLEGFRETTPGCFDLGMGS